MHRDMKNALKSTPTAPIGRLKGTGIKLKVIDKNTKLPVNYGVQLNNTTLEIEALSNLEVTIENANTQNSPQISKLLDELEKNIDLIQDSGKDYKTFHGKSRYTTIIHLPEDWGTFKNRWLREIIE